MALLACVDCGGKVSDKAVACPHCGCPVSYTLKHIEESKKICVEVGEDTIQHLDKHDASFVDDGKKVESHDEEHADAGVCEETALEDAEEIDYDDELTSEEDIEISIMYEDVDFDEIEEDSSNYRRFIETDQKEAFDEINSKYGRLLDDDL